MKKVGFLIFCLFAMCSMAGKAQDVVADSIGYIVKVGEMAPDFTVKLTDGKSITPVSYTHLTLPTNREV